jgi:hypothetical protein
MGYSSDIHAPREGSATATMAYSGNEGNRQRKKRASEG